MKRLILLILAFFLTGTPIQANAAPTLDLGMAIEQEDGTASLNLSLSGGTEAYAGMNAKILLPKGITVTGVSEGERLSSGNFTVRYQTFSDASNDGVIVVAYSNTGTFGPSDGILLTLALQVDDSVLSGEHKISFAGSNPTLVNSRYALSNSDGSNSVTLSPKAGTIFVDPPDVDVDGLPDPWEQQIIDASDTITAIEHVLPNDDFDEDGFTNLAEYDNGSGRFDPTDAASPEITLADAIIVLKVVCGIDTGYGFPDMSDDEKTGLEEAIFILQTLGEI